jgi:hypothetical protein
MQIRSDIRIRDFLETALCEKRHEYLLLLGSSPSTLHAVYKSSSIYLRAPFYAR